MHKIESGEKVQVNQPQLPAEEEVKAKIEEEEPPIGDKSGGNLKISPKAVYIPNSSMLSLHSNRSRPERPEIDGDPVPFTLTIPTYTQVASEDIQESGV
jgi:hypothetical protein